MTFDMDSTERTCRTKVLAGSATDATLRINYRNTGRIISV